MASQTVAAVAHAARHASGGADALTPAAIGAATDLTDVMVSAASAALTAGQNSNVTSSGGTFTAPAPAGTVATPPQRFALTNLSTGTVTLTFPNQAGTSVTLTVLPGEVVTLRQKSTNGYAAESGNKPLTQLDGRYAPILTSAPSAWAANTAYVKGQTVTQGGYFQTAIANFTSGSTFSQANWVQGAPTAPGTGGTATPSALLPTNAIVETVNRKLVNTGTIAVTSGTFRATLVDLAAGTVVSSLTFLNGNSAASGLTHNWFAILDSTGKVLGVSNDDTANWSASVPRTLTLTSPVTIPSTGAYYLGRCMVASTMPTSTGYIGLAASDGLTPVLVGALTGQSTPPAVGATLTLSAASNLDYGYAA